jgi:hypothetical protein
MNRRTLIAWVVLVAVLVGGYLFFEFYMLRSN